MFSKRVLLLSTIISTSLWVVGSGPCTTTANTPEAGLAQTTPAAKCDEAAATIQKDDCSAQLAKVIEDHCRATTEACPTGQSCQDDTTDDGTTDESTSDEFKVSDIGTDDDHDIIYDGDDQDPDEIPVDAKIVVTFNDTVDCDSFDNGSGDDVDDDDIQVLDESDDPVPGDWDCDGDEATFEPTDDLDNDADYTVDVNDACEDLEDENDCLSDDSNEVSSGFHTEAA